MLVSFRVLNPLRRSRASSPEGGELNSLRQSAKFVCSEVTPSVIAYGDATLPLLSLRDIFPPPGEVGPQGDGFWQ